MLSIFDQKDFEQPAEKKLKLNRLQEVLGPTQSTAVNPGPAATPAAPVDTPPAAKLAPKQQPMPERKPLAPPVPEVLCPPAPIPPVAEDLAIPVELHQFADQFTRGFREVLVNTVRDLQAPAVEDRKKVESALDSATRAARELQNLSSSLEVACQKIDSLTRAVEELNAKYCDLADSVKVTSAAAHALQEGQQSLEKQAGEQSDSLRSLGAALQSDSERFDRFFSALQALQPSDSSRTSRRTLAEAI